MKEKGFIHIIIIVIIGVVALAYFGFDPVSIWENIVLPIIQGIWNIFIMLLSFLVNIISGLVGK
jgi:ABC-type uncharacterized transport system permease subunit